MAHVSLREVVESNVRPVMDLAVRADQRRYVADNARTIAEHAYADEAWLRSIYADEVPVGLLLLSERRSLPRYYLWRFMIDARHQGCGYGRAAMGLLVEYVRTLPNAFELFVSYLPGDASPYGFYTKIGFVDTGREHGVEREMLLRL